MNGTMPGMAPPHLAMGGGTVHGPAAGDAQLAAMGANMMAPGSQQPQPQGGLMMPPGMYVNGPGAMVLPPGMMNVDGGQPPPMQMPPPQ